MIITPLLLTVAITLCAGAFAYEACEQHNLITRVLCATLGLGLGISAPTVWWVVL